MSGLNRGGGLVTMIGTNDPCGEALNKAIKEMSTSKAYREAINTNIGGNIMNYFIPRVLNEINAILPVLANDVHDDETIRQNKQTLRVAYLKQRKKGTLERAETNWTNQLRLLYKRRELKKDLIKLIEVFERGLKDYIILGNEEKDYAGMLVNINNLINYFRAQLKENERRHNLKNKTTISIEQGLQCKLIAAY
jgi:hypothetical protein